MFPVFNTRLNARIEAIGRDIWLQTGGWSVDEGWPKDARYPDIPF